MFELKNWLRNLTQKPNGRSPARRKRLALEALENRITPVVPLGPTTLYVDNTPGMAGTQFTPSGGTQTPVGGLTPGVSIFSTISEAVAVAAPGDTVNVADGTYNELVSIDKALTIQGNKFGLDARTRMTLNESIVSNASGDFQILADDVTIDGFTIRDVNASLFAGVHIAVGSNSSGYLIQNNVIANNAEGIYANSDATATIRQNLFDGNNQGTSGANAGIYTESTSGLIIDNNTFVNHVNVNPILIGAISTTANANLTVTNNSLTGNTGATAIYVDGVSGGLFQGNSITTGGTATALSFSGADTNIDVLNNVFSDNVRGVRIVDFGDFGGGTPNSNIRINKNSFSNNTQYNIGIQDDGGGGVGYVGGLLNASANYFGTSDPTVVAATLASPGPLASTIDFTPLLDNDESVANQSVVGFQADLSSVTVHTLGAQAGIVGRIQEGVNVVTAGGTVNVLAGTYSLTAAVNVNKTVTLNGAQAGVDARTRMGSESIVDGTGVTAFPVAAFSVPMGVTGVVIDGFTLQNVTGNQAVGAVFLNAGSNGSTIQNNIIQNNTAGVFLANNSAMAQTVISQNLFQNNNDGVGNLLNTDIYADQFTAGSNLQNVLIDNNTFTNTSLVVNSWALGISNTGMTAFSNITFSNNEVTNHGRGAYFFNTTASSVTGNTISGTSNYAIGLFGSNGTPANSMLTISGNTLSGNQRGVYLSSDTMAAAYSGPLTLTGNDFTTSMGQFSIHNDSATPIDATNNTFNTILATAATDAQQFTIVDTIIDGVDQAGGGLVRTKAGNVYVTTNSFNTAAGFLAPTNAASIQRGIDAATSGDVVNVQAGTYAGDVNAVTPTKSVTLAPAGSDVGTVTVMGNLSLNTGDTLQVTFNSATMFDVLAVQGTVSVGGATLSTNGLFVPTVNSGERFVVLDNDMADAVSGTFNGGQFSFVSINGTPARLVHNGGNGNDVELIVTSQAAFLVNGDLVVVGTNVGETISVDTNNAADVKVTVAGVLQVNPEMGSMGKFAIANAATGANSATTFDPMQKRLIIFGFGGNDTISVAGPINAEISGGDGDDYVISGSGNDVISGDAGSDLIYGRNGNDFIVGGAGALDQLFGDDGDDVLVGGTFIPGTNSGADWTYAALRTVSAAWAASAGGAAGAAAASPDLFDQSNVPPTGNSDRDILDPATERDRLTGGNGKDWVFISGTGDRVLGSIIATDYTTSF